MQYAHVKAPKHAKPAMTCRSNNLSTAGDAGGGVPKLTVLPTRQQEKNDSHVVSPADVQT